MADLGVGEWALVALCVLLAIAVPIVERWRTTPAALRERYLLWRPGSVLAAAIVRLLSAVLTLAMAILVATAYPWGWATVLLASSVLASTIATLVRYRRVARAEGERLLTEEARETSVDG